MKRTLFQIAAFGAVIVLTQAPEAGFAAGPGGHSHDQMNKANSAHGHHHHGKAIMIPSGPKAPSISLMIKKDPVGGWNVHIHTKNFRFAPENASASHIVGEGHAHLYVNDKKIARVYGAWFHIGELPTGKSVVRVTLNANNHRALVVGGKTVAASQTVDVPGHTH